MCGCEILGFTVSLKKHLFLQAPKSRPWTTFPILNTTERFTIFLENTKVSPRYAFLGWLFPLGVIHPEGHYRLCCTNPKQRKTWEVPPLLQQSPAPSSPATRGHSACPEMPCSPPLQAAPTQVVFFFPKSGTPWLLSP